MDIRYPLDTASLKVASNMTIISAELVDLQPGDCAIQLSSESADKIVHAQ